jgi:transcription initiation factor IIE alpha subunit
MTDKPFKCPNCKNKMSFNKQIRHEKEIYDKWICDECPLIVLDWRSKRTSH